MKRYWPLLIPFVLGVALIVLVTAAAQSATSPNQMEGALMGMGILGMGYSLLAFPTCTLLLMETAEKTRVTFAVYAALLFAATLPVAYFQAVNPQTSLMPILWGWIPSNGRPSTAFFYLMNAVSYVVLFSVCAALSYLPVRKRNQAPES